MLRRLMVLCVLSILMVALSGLVLADPRVGFEPTKSFWDPPESIGQPDDDEDSDDNGLGFGKKIAGAWLGSGDFALDLDCDGVADDPESATPFAYDSQSFTASGLWIATNPNNPNLGHGTWAKIGPREITADSIVYLNDPATGELLWIMRIPGVFTFDQDFETATSVYGAIGYFPGQDPLDPTIDPAWCTAGRHYLLRKVPASQ